MMKKQVILLICGVLLACIMISGCTNNPTTTNNDNLSTTSYQKHTIICSNPDCSLHDPNHYTAIGRPIDMEVGDTTAGGSKTVYYLCQVCGEQWSG
jgi:hypothetical protein